MKKRSWFVCVAALACSGITDTGWSTGNITTWGDSLTDGQPFTRAESYPTQLSALFPNRVVTNEGIGGETSTQIVVRLLADTTHRHDITILWMGRNNLEDPSGIRSDVAKAVRALATSHFVVLAILNGDFYGTEAKGAPGYDNIIALNTSFALAYPRNYLDIRSYLVSLYDPTNPQDVQDHLRDIPPSSLRAHWNGGIDLLHLSPEANAKVAGRVATFIEDRGW
jgi:lysophospholipase L1-like esterase